MGHHGGHQMTPVMPPHHGGIRGITGASDVPHDTPMLFFGNLVKKLDNLSL